MNSAVTRPGGVNYGVPPARPRSVSPTVPAASLYPAASMGLGNPHWVAPRSVSPTPPPVALPHHYAGRTAAAATELPHSYAGRTAIVGEAGQPIAVQVDSLLASLNPARSGGLVISFVGPLDQYSSVLGQAAKLMRARMRRCQSWCRCPKPSWCRRQPSRHKL